MIQVLFFPFLNPPPPQIKSKGRTKKIRGAWHRSPPHKGYRVNWGCIADPLSPLPNKTHLPPTPFPPFSSGCTSQRPFFVHIESPRSWYKINRYTKNPFCYLHLCRFYFIENVSKIRRGGGRGDGGRCTFFFKQKGCSNSSVGWLLLFLKI